jgi:hypothetical protein
MYDRCIGSQWFGSKVKKPRRHGLRPGQSLKVVWVRSGRDWQVQNHRSIVSLFCFWIRMIIDMNE